MSVPYDLLDVEWGEETLRARPVKWNIDITTSETLNPEEADDVYITEYELSCPSCGCLCRFKILDETIRCDCGSETINPMFAYNPTLDEENENLDISDEAVKAFTEIVMALEEDEEDEDEENEDEENEEDEDLKRNIEEAKKDLAKEKPTSPRDVLNDLEASIANTEIALEDPDEDDKKVVEEAKLSAKKTKKKSKKTNKK
jgi:hypothetical protein